MASGLSATRAASVWAAESHRQLCQILLTKELLGQRRVWMRLDHHRISVGQSSHLVLASTHTSHSRLSAGKSPHLEAAAAFNPSEDSGKPGWVPRGHARPGRLQTHTREICLSLTEACHSSGLLVELSHQFPSVSVLQ